MTHSEIQDAILAIAKIVKCGGVRIRKNGKKKVFSEVNNLRARELTCIFFGIMFFEEAEKKGSYGKVGDLLNFERKRSEKRDCIFGNVETLPGQWHE